MGGYEIAIMCTYLINLTIVWRKFYVLKFALIYFGVIFHAFYFILSFLSSADIFQNSRFQNILPGALSARA